MHARSQAEKLNGRAAMMGYVIAIFVDKASGAGLAEQQNSFLGLLALHITVFAILAIRCARRAVRAARMHARTHALRTRAEACVASATDAPWGELVGPERGAWALHACLHAALPSTRPGACSAAPVPHQHAHTAHTRAPLPACPQRQMSDLDNFKNLLDEATFYDKQWNATWENTKRPSEK